MLIPPATRPHAFFSPLLYILMAHIQCHLLCSLPWEFLNPCFSSVDILNPFYCSVHSSGCLRSLLLGVEPVQFRETSSFTLVSFPVSLPHTMTPWHPLSPQHVLDTIHVNGRHGWQLPSGTSAGWNLRGMEHTCEPGISVTIDLLKSSETHWNESDH